MSKNAEQIKQLEEQIVKLKAEDNAFAALSEDQQVAVTLHKMLCRHNHIDGCGWEYEFANKQHDWTGREHEVYMQKALMLRGFCHERGMTTETAIDLFTLIRGF